MIEFILEPLQYAFMVRGMIAAVLVGIVCAVVGTYVVLRGMAFFGDALAHSILPGVAIGYLVAIFIRLVEDFKIFFLFFSFATTNEQLPIFKSTGI